MAGQRLQTQEGVMAFFYGRDLLDKFHAMGAFDGGGAMPGLEVGSKSFTAEVLDGPGIIRFGQKYGVNVTLKPKKTRKRMTFLLIASGFGWCGWQICSWMAIAQTRWRQRSPELHLWRGAPPSGFSLALCIAGVFIVALYPPPCML